MADNLKPVARIVTACCVLHNISKKFSVPLPSKLVLDYLHPEPELRQEEQGNVYTKEAIEEIIEMYFGDSGDEEEREELKNHADTQTRYKQNDNTAHKNFCDLV